jgi:hypothetical protein
LEVADINKSCLTCLTMTIPDDLVFASVRTGQPMRDNNILTRFIKPAGPTMRQDTVRRKSKNQNGGRA